VACIIATSILPSPNNGGINWIESAEPINDDWDWPSHTANQVSPDLAYDAARNRVYAVWQDGRDGNFDIYFAYQTREQLEHESEAK